VIHIFDSLVQCYTVFCCGWVKNFAMLLWISIHNILMISTASYFTTPTPRRQQCP